MAKFQLLHQYLNAHGLADPGQMHQPLSAPRRWLELVHPRGYHQAFALQQLDRAAQRRIGLPINPAVIRRTWLAVGGTVLTARLALRHGLACHLAGGTHHAFPAMGSGFCIFNDVAVAAKVLMQDEGITQLMVIDLDVHQGDATATIFADDPRVITVSVHAANNFPLRKALSDLDVALPDGLDDDGYLGAIGDQLPALLDRHQPQMVLYNARVDPHQEDRLGRLALSDAGLRQRDHLVIDACLRRQIALATVIGGGYDNLNTLVARHGIVFRAAREEARLHGL